MIEKNKIFVLQLLCISRSGKFLLWIKITQPCRWQMEENNPVSFFSQSFFWAQYVCRPVKAYPKLTQNLPMFTEVLVVRWANAFRECQRLFFSLPRHKCFLRAASVKKSRVTKCLSKTPQTVSPSWGLRGIQWLFLCLNHFVWKIPVVKHRFVFSF